MSDDNQEIKPCLYCGGEMRTARSITGGRITCCNSCSMTGPPVRFEGCPLPTVKEVAAKAIAAHNAAWERLCGGDTPVLKAHSEQAEQDEIN